MPTGTATRITRFADRRPTPTAIGASSAAEQANTTNQAATLPCDSRNADKDVADGLVEDVGVRPHSRLFLTCT